MEEIWKDIEGYEGLYQVSNLGRVKSLDRTITNSLGVKTRYKGRLMTQTRNRGYWFVNLSKNGKATPVGVHRLVAIAFIPNPNNYPAVMHLDGKNLKFDGECNNNVENLAWGTPKMNMEHPLTLERISGEHSKLYWIDHKLGANAAARKVICDNIVFGCIKECAIFYEVNPKTMQNWMCGHRKMPEKFVKLGLRYKEENK